VKVTPRAVGAILGFAGTAALVSADAAPRYHVEGGWMAEPGTRRYGGELRFSLALSGRSLIWYGSEPGRTIGSSNMEGVPWPPEERAILTLVD
jgi:hypothetical protein